MSSLTKVQFRVRLKLRNPIKKLADADAENLIDLALEAYSQHFPQFVTQKNITYVDANSYSFPSDGLKLSKVVDADSNNEKTFQVEISTSSVKTYTIGNFASSSPEGDGLTEIDYYVNPTASEYLALSSTGADGKFNLIYSRLQTVPTISDLSLDTLRSYIEYLYYEDKASDIENYVDIVDREVSGASTTTKASGIQKMFVQMAESKLSEFMKAVQIPYGNRG